MERDSSWKNFMSLMKVIFYNEQTRNDNEILIKKDPKTMKNVAVNVHNNQLLRNMRVIHETDDYLFAIHRYIFTLCRIY